MSDDDPFFDRMRRVAGQLSDPATRDEQFEETIVCRLATWAGWNTGRAGLRTLAQSHGLQRPGFDLLTRTCPALGMQFGARKIPNVHVIRFVSLFGPGFFTTPWFAAYKEFLAAQNIDHQAEPAGLVFNAPQAKNSSYLLLHNAPDTLGAGDNTVVRVLATFKGVTFCIEPFKEFAERHVEWFQQ